MPSELSPPEQALIDAAMSLTANLDLEATCSAMLDIVGRMFGAESSWILLHEPASGCLITRATRGPKTEAFKDVEIPCDRGIVGRVFTRGEMVFVPDVSQDDRWFDAARVRRSGLRSVLNVPLIHRTTPIGLIGLDSPRFTSEARPTAADLARLGALAAQAAIGIQNARHHQSVEEDRLRLRRLLQERRQLRGELGHLRDEVREARSFTSIVGDSAALRAVLAQVDVVAPAESTVLLTGETGTGKELIARAIHDGSRRATGPFVAVNCAALPDALVESELFGHEKGAFTGAVGRKLGKFELADRGTLFLDEVGDLPQEAQAKLLRVLQEREVQRVGGTRSVPVNVRLIAATNQALERLMQDGRFRPDLFYRLSVFPLALPPLRERVEDIAPLVEHFARHFAERLGKPAPRIELDAMEQLRAYEWPGNIRELQNIIERAVILARGAVIGHELIPVSPGLSAVTAPAAAPAPHGTAVPAPVSAPAPPSATILPFTESERRAILRAVEATGWRISGRGGAAEMLGLKPTTLHAKMKRLGISRPSAHRTA